MKYPKTIGTTADRIWKIQQERLGLQKKVDALKAQQTEMENHFIKLCRAQNTDTGRGQLATVSVQRKTVPQVEDWGALYRYIETNEAWDLLQRRVALGAWRARLEDDHKVPGTRVEYVDTVSIHRRAG